jgi:HAD superfamily hydrolase (TIGR01549 family)
MKNIPRYIRAVLFDFDGTLTKPDSLDLSVLKETVGCPKDSYLLEYIQGLSDPGKQKQAYAALEDYEMQSAAGAEPNTGAEDLVGYLQSRELPIGIITRNSLRSVERALQNFERIGMQDFDLVISRDEPIRPKPSGDGIVLAAEKFGVSENELLIVGDFLLDIQAGQEAGAITALVNNPKLPVPETIECHFRVACISDIEPIVRLGLPLPAGKLPNEFLELFLKDFDLDDPSVLIKPRVGEDTAAVDIENEEIAVLKTDPITFATDAIGSYAVLVNANDIATAGAVPRWFLTTLMFPVGTSGFIIHDVMDRLDAVCRQWGITLCGGHTEITDAVNRPVVTGMMVGTVTRNGIIDKQNIQSGDRVLLTKGVCVEGTAIIAREFGSELARLGVAPEDLKNYRRFLDHISILKEARIAADTPGVSALHDVTEGGLATAVEELSMVGGHRIRIEMDNIPVYDETERICDLLMIDPLGLIGSGSLLICCSDAAHDILKQKLEEAGIQVTVIGIVIDAGKGVEAVRGNAPAEWPKFEADEITRLF